VESEEKTDIAAKESDKKTSKDLVNNDADTHVIDADAVPELKLVTGSVVTKGDYIRILKGDNAIPSVVLQVEQDGVEVHFFSKADEGWKVSDVVHNLQASDINAKILKPEKVGMSKSRVRYEFADL
jgi:hypothetical protein